MMSFDQKPLPMLVIEVYKSLMKTTPDIVSDFYTKAPATCNLNTGGKLCLPKANTTRCGLNVLTFHRSLLRNIKSKFG